MIIYPDAKDNVAASAEASPRTYDQGKLIRNAVVEMIGTFMLLTTIVFAVSSGSTNAPLAIGLGLAVFVYAGGPVSGGHFNPAVTLAVFLRGKQYAEFVGAAAYMVSQILGAVLGTVLATMASPGDPIALKLAGHRSLASTDAPTIAVDSPNRFDCIKAADTYKALYCEFIFTFLLCWVVLQTATSKKAGPDGVNSYFGLAIGLSVFVGATCIGGISGCAMNPAVAIGLILGTGAGIPSYCWIYIVGPFLGALMAIAVYAFVNPEELVDQDKPHE